MIVCSMYCKLHEALDHAYIVPFSMFLFNIVVFKCSYSIDRFIFEFIKLMVSLFAYSYFLRILLYFSMCGSYLISDALTTLGTVLQFALAHV